VESRDEIFGNDLLESGIPERGVVVPRPLVVTAKECVEWAVFETFVGRFADFCP
jgi:hypothetical protein